MELRIRIRTLVLLLMLFVRISSIQAQNTGDIDPLSIWRVENNHFDGYNVFADDYKYHIIGTIGFDSLEYYRIYKTGREVNMSNGDIYYYTNKYVGGLREEGNKWYKLINDSVDVLLYDFNQNVGDTLNSYLALDSIITILDIDTIMIDGEPKKKFHLLGVGWNDEGFIIEDVGACTGLFEPMIFYEYHSAIHCYVINNIPLWINPAIGECDLTVGINENNKTNNALAHPNPFTTSTTIEFELNRISNLQLTVYNVMGERVHRAEYRSIPQGSHKITWSPGHIPGGMYYGVLRSEDGMSVVKIIKQ